MARRVSTGAGTASVAGGHRRSDAERNAAAIVEAATELFARDPDASMTDIARAAGIGRVTIYGHFPSREELVRTVLKQAIDTSTEIIESTRSTGLPPADGFAHLIRTTWPLIGRFGRLYDTAQRALPADEVRQLHDPPMAHVRQLIVQGQETGQFRTDLPREWLVTTVYALLHAALEEVTAKRFDQADAGGILAKTLLSVLRVESENGCPRQV
jgi:AcrR family transcriptional regulator